MIKVSNVLNYHQDEKHVKVEATCDWTGCQNRQIVSGPNVFVVVAHLKALTEGRGWSLPEATENTGVFCNLHASPHVQRSRQSAQHAPGCPARCTCGAA